MKSDITSAECLKNFLETTPPLKKKTISTNMAENIDQCYLPQLELFCVECGKERNFQATRYSETVSEHSFLFKSTESTIAEMVEKEIALCGPESNYQTYYQPYCDSEGRYIAIEDGEIFVQYACTYCQKKYYFVLGFSLRNISKLCQYPSFAMLNYKNIEKYSRELKKYYDEYKQSLSAYSQGMGVASFVYLRRILEHLVESKFDKLANKPAQARFIDKLKAVDKVENIIPEGLEEIKNALYTVLSKGVHEYSEEECLTMYEPVNFIIELILDKQLADKERAQKLKRCKSAILAKAGEKNDTTN